jgi:hypothetical protein
MRLSILGREVTTLPVNHLSTKSLIALLIKQEITGK